MLIYRDSNTSLICIVISNVFSVGYHAEQLQAATKCVECLSGTFQDKAAKSSCRDCPEGYIAEHEHSMLCSACAAGLYASEKLSAKKCISCEVGQFQTQSATTICTPCSEGKGTHCTCKAALSLFSHRVVFLILFIIFFPVAKARGSAFCTSCSAGDRLVM